MMIQLRDSSGLIWVKVHTSWLWWEGGGRRGWLTYFNCFILMCFCSSVFGVEIEKEIVKAHKKGNSVIVPGLAILLRFLTLKDFMYSLMQQSSGISPNSATIGSDYSKEISFYPDLSHWQWTTLWSSITLQGGRGGQRSWWGNFSDRRWNFSTRGGKKDEILTCLIQKWTLRPIFFHRTSKKFCTLLQ